MDISITRLIFIVSNDNKKAPTLLNLGGSSEGAGVTLTHKVKCKQCKVMLFLTVMQTHLSK
jgi:hypothetical protein